MSLHKNRPGRRVRPEDSITAQQYQTGWNLLSTGHTVQQILSATGLTRPQLLWLTKVGDESRSMPAYNQRLAEQVARIRARGHEAADAIGAGAVDAVKRSMEITTVAQTLARNILAAHFKTKVQPAVNAMQSGAASPEMLSEMAMSKPLRETLKTLKHYADFTETARAFRTVFDSPHQTRDPLTQMPKEAKLDLSGEALLPAATALIEEISGEQGVGHDVVNDLLPEMAGWTEEETNRFISTGERPDGDFSFLDVEAIEESAGEP